MNCDLRETSFHMSSSSLSFHREKHGISFTSDITHYRTEAKAERKDTLGPTKPRFSRRFRRKSRLLPWLVSFRQFNAIGPLFVH